MTDFPPEAYEGMAAAEVTTWWCRDSDGHEYEWPDWERAKRHTDRARCLLVRRDTTTTVFPPAVSS